MTTCGSLGTHFPKIVLFNFFANNIVIDISSEICFIFPPLSSFFFCYLVVEVVAGISAHFVFEGCLFFVTLLSMFADSAVVSWL